jgi:putative endonuclease
MWDRSYYVYIIANATRILYTGVTNNLVRRMDEHRSGEIDGFTSHFHVCRLVYYETFHDIRNAIAREKQIKRWRREKKIWLIERLNQNWKDLSDGSYEEKGIAPRLALKRSLGVTDDSGQASNT